MRVRIAPLTLLLLLSLGLSAFAQKVQTPEEKIKELEERLKGLEGKVRDISAVEVLGMTVQSLTDEAAEKFGLQGQRGVVVTALNPEGEASQMGLQVGDLILGVRHYDASRDLTLNRRVRTLDDFRRYVPLLKEERTSEVEVMRGGGSIFVRVGR